MEVTLSSCICKCIVFDNPPKHLTENSVAIPQYIGQHTRNTENSEKWIPNLIGKHVRIYSDILLRIYWYLVHKFRHSQTFL